jgi:prevent-host-death family protein
MADSDDDPILEVSAAELNRRFGEVRRRAVTGPVAVTYHGRRSLILIALEEYQRLQAGDSAADSADWLRRRMSVLMDYVSEGYFAIASDWTIADCNRTAELFVGRTRDEMIGRSFEDAFPTAKLDLAPVRRAMEFGEIVHIERASSIHPDRQLVITAFPLPGPEGGVGALFSNVTERTRMLATIREKDVAIAFLLAECQDRLIFMVNDQKKIEHWGVGGQAILGWSADDVLARPLQRILAGSDAIPFGPVTALGFTTRAGQQVRASGMIQSLGPGGARLFMLSPDS